MKADKNELERLTALCASGGLTAAEREKLFAAALEDQVLFEVLAHEDAVRDALELPGAKDRVIEGLKPKRSRWFVWAGGLAAAATAAIVFVLVRPSPVSDRTVPAENHAPRQMQAEVPSMRETEAPAPIAKAKNNAPIPPRKPIPDGRAKQVSLSDSGAVDFIKPTDTRQEVQIADNRILKERAESAPVNGPVRAPAPTAPAGAAGVVGGVLEPQPFAAPATMGARAKPSFSVAANSGGLARSMMPQPLYTVLLKNAAGEFVPAGQNQAFQKGDTVRVALVAPITGRMTVNNSGQISSQLVNAGQRYFAPDEGEIVLDKPSGETLIGVTFQVDLTAEMSKKSLPGRNVTADAIVAPTHLDIRITYK